MNRFTPPFEIETSTLNIFKFDEFRKFIIENGVVTSSISIIIANQLDKLINTLVESLIDPLLKPDADKDGQNDLKFLIAHKTNVGPFSFKTGKSIYEFIRFFVILYLVFIVSRFVIDAIN